MKKAIKILLIFAAVLVIMIVGLGLLGTNGLKEGAELVINEIDPSTLADGVYIGRYEAGRWTNEVSVTIKNGRIEDIQLVKDVMLSKYFSDQIFEQVIEKQSTDVDVISGATVTSKAYLKAIENALAH